LRWQRAVWLVWCGLWAAVRLAGSARLTGPADRRRHRCPDRASPIRLRPGRPALPDPDPAPPGHGQGGAQRGPSRSPRSRGGSPSRPGRVRRRERPRRLRRLRVASSTRRPQQQCACPLVLLAELVSCVERPVRGAVGPADEVVEHAVDARHAATPQLLLSDDGIPGELTPQVRLNVSPSTAHVPHPCHGGRTGQLGRRAGVGAVWSGIEVLLGVKGPGRCSYTASGPPDVGRLLLGPPEALDTVHMRLRCARLVRTRSAGAVHYSA
jgi:hypothetical protein